MKTTIAIKKAYQVDLSKIEEGYLYSDLIIHADNRNQAKSHLLSENKYEGLRLRGSDDEVTYLTIPVIRAKECDKYIFESQEKTKHEIDEILYERKREAKLNSFLTDPKITHCYIRKGSYYRPNSCGYTDYKHLAGVYSIKEGVSDAKSCRDIYLEIIDVEKHNNMVIDMINELKSRIIN